MACLELICFIHMTACMCKLLINLGVNHADAVMCTFVIGPNNHQDEVC